MLSPRLTNCPECANIPSLLKKIDCKLAELGNNLYNNISYMLNKPVPSSDILQLIGYRRILMYKYCNPSYVEKYSVQMIASRVIRLTAGCVSKCNELERCLEEPCDIKIVPNPTTTSTSTLPITTTTSTSSTTSTTTTVVPTTTTTSSSSTSTTTSTSSSTTTTSTTICQDCVPVSFTNPDTGNGVTTLPNGLVITTTYVGPSIAVTAPRNNSTNCGGFPMDANTLYLGQLNGAFTLTISFSAPVNDVYISNSSMGYNLYPNQQECFTVNSDQGTPTLTLAGGCYDYGPVGNQICGSYQGGNTGGATRVSTTTSYTQLTITGTGIGNLAGYGFDICFPSCITTTTTSTTLSPAECAALILNSGNIYTYDVTTNTSVNHGYYSGSNDVASTATKMWFMSTFIEEYNITVSPWSAVPNRNITYNTQLAFGNGLCAKDNVTLITTNGSVPFPHPIVSVDITGSTAVETIIGYLPTNIFVTGDLIYTTTGKLIITTSNAVNGEAYIMQYDYATMNLEVQSTLPPSINNAFGLIEANNKLYIVGSTGAIYEVNLNFPYGLTLIQLTGLVNVAGASQVPSCCNVNLIPQSSSTTTTSSTTAIPIECLVYLTTNGKVYVYDPISNLSVEILSGVNNYFQVANTDTKLWSIQGGGYINEFDITFSPGPSPTYNRLINTGSIFSSGTFAIDNTTLIVGDGITSGIYELDITTNTSINTLKGNIEAGYFVNDLLLTTSGKLIIVATNPPNNTSTKVYQYDYATWTLEISFDLSSQLPALTYGVGIAQYNGDIYIFTRIVSCGNAAAPSGVYILDPLTNNITLVNSTGFSCPSGASSWLPCNTTKLTPGVIPTTTTTSSSSSTTTTSTTLAPSGFNTIYTTFDAL